MLDWNYDSKSSFSIQSFILSIMLLLRVNAYSTTNYKNQQNSVSLNNTAFSHNYDNYQFICALETWNMSCFLGLLMKTTFLYLSVILPLIA